MVAIQPQDMLVAVHRICMLAALPMQVASVE